MKKLIFGLIAVVIFGMNANAQEPSKEEARTYAAKVMVEFKNALEPSYNDSRSFEEFIKNSTGPYSPQGIMTKEGINMLKVAYNYLSNKTSNDKIIESYDGTEVALAFKYLLDNSSKDEGELFGISISNTKNTGGKGGPSVDFDKILNDSNNNFRCCFFCLKCHLTTVFGEEGGTAVLNAIVEAIIKAILG
ncbi:hypothetical protein [uncultured Flavobacterium sp.]|uniref:hypothetical protein n=1 Tax=uncultured Flavobacterium sp. TaxID=165435 RepID=UPI0030C8BFD6